MTSVKGWRTLAWSAIVAVAGVLEVFDWTTVVPAGVNQGYVLLAIGGVTALLRYITTTPVGTSQ